MKLNIVYKLVVLILSITALAVGLIAGFTRYSINAGFSTYVERAELSRIDSLAPVLEWEYGRRRGWGRIKQDPDAMWWLIAFNESRNGRRSPPLDASDRPPPPADFPPPPDKDEIELDPEKPAAGPRFDRSSPPEGAPAKSDFPPDKTPPVVPLDSADERPLPPGGDRHSFKSVNDNTPKTRQDDGRRPPGERLPPPFPPMRMEVFRRLGLFDSTKQLVWGNSNSVKAREQIVLRKHGLVIGYLKLAPVERLTKAMDRDFVEAQNRNLLGVCLFAFSLAALAGLVMSQDIVGAISILVQGTRQLAAGNFKTRINLMRRDELGQLAQDFNTLADALEKHDRSHRQWIADTSHELRTPIAVLRAQVEALQDGVQEPNQRTLGVLHGEIMTLNKLVDDLYHLAKSDVGELRYHIARVDIPALLLEIAEAFEERFETKSISVETDFSNCSHLVDADQSRLRQLFLNLMENSLRYTDAGGKIKISGHEEENSLVLWFDDSHPGVAEELLPKIFERFFRGELSRSRDFGGCGLGLAICRTIVEGHGGSISASHSPLGGLRIQVRFTLSGGN